MVIAPNAFKGSLSAGRAAEAIARGVKAVFPEAELYLVPMADGGDGTTECLIRATGGRIFRKRVAGPLGEPVEGFWGLTGGGRTAVVEVAAASGLALVPADRRDPLGATSHGTGELIREALGSGCREIFIGLGGSATTDAGAGLLQALGVRLLDSRGQEIGRGGAALQDLDRIDLSSLDPRLREVSLVAGCDVDNPLYGPQGAAYVYAPQKGASGEQLSFLDSCLRRFAAVVERDLQVKVGEMAGGGAAGGIGAALAGVLGARLVSGVQEIVRLTGLPELLRREDISLLITGEGEINPQSLRGKVPVGLARLARQYGIPVLVLAGGIRLDPQEAHRAGISALMAIVDAPMDLPAAMERAEELLEGASRRAMQLLAIGRGWAEAES